MFKCINELASEEYAEAKKKKWECKLRKVSLYTSQSLDT